MIGFFNFRRSVACAMLMVVLLGQSSPTSATDCPQVDLDTKLTTVLEKANSANWYAWALKHPFVRENCVVDLASSGYDDSAKYAYVKTSGGSSDDVYVISERSERGVTLFELDPETCRTRNRQTFDTYALGADSMQLVETLESAQVGTIIIGVTSDSTQGELAKFAGPVFERNNMDLNGLVNREKFAFILQKGYPKKTIFQRKPKGGESLKMKVTLNGNNLADVAFKQV